MWAPLLSLTLIEPPAAGLESPVPIPSATHITGINSTLINTPSTPPCCWQASRAARESTDPRRGAGYGAGGRDLRSKRWGVSNSRGSSACDPDWVVTRRLPWL